DPRPLWRVLLPPAAGTLAGIAGSVRFDWGGALMWLRSDADEASIIAAAQAAGGHARRALGGAITAHDPAVAALGERVRAGFDPNGVLNPRAPARAMAA
ncbi:MAG: hypothetical protein K2X68_14565, partial [Novosphingobium sp.]|nr:hypothetical protein [Novosphingobium sp.]